jgi:hypothetical protein
MEKEEEMASVQLSYFILSHSLPFETLPFKDNCWMHWLVHF